MRSAARLIHDERGSTLVEFALVAPVVLLILVCCLDFARALNAYVTITNASREGARYATLHPAVDNEAIRAAVAARSMPLDTSAIGVAVTYDDGSGPRPWPDAGLPETLPAPLPISIRVTTSYDWHASTWIAGTFFSITTGSRTFGSESTMVAIR